MSCVTKQSEPRLPVEIIVLIITYLPTARHFLQSRCTSRDIDYLLKSYSTRKEWLLNLPLSPKVLSIANVMKIGLPFGHARLAMEQGVEKRKMQSLSTLSDHYLNDALPPFLYNIAILQKPLPEDFIVLEEAYLQYFVFRSVTTQSKDYSRKWIEESFGQDLKANSIFLSWINQAFETSISEFYTIISKRISGKHCKNIYRTRIKT